MKQGVPVAIVEKPNAGKSSLLNALVQDDKAIVSEIAGTTRDIEDTTLMEYSFVYRHGRSPRNRRCHGIQVEKVELNLGRPNLL